MVQEARHPFAELSATAAARAIRTGEMRAVSYAEVLVEEARTAAALNVFITFEPDVVLEAAHQADRLRNSGATLGPLHGIPIAVKDSINATGMPTTNGTASLSAFRPAANAAVVQRVVDSGAIVMGKTNLTELSFGWTSNNGTFGAVRNPYRHDLVPGGSSGGSAAAVAARIAPLSIGADTLGSIRVPAAFCGVAGYRPTFGRYPNSGAFGLTQDKLDQVGPMARTVEDLALFDSVFSGTAPSPERPPLAGIRIGIPPYYHSGLEASVQAVVDNAYDRLRDAGAVLVVTEIPDIMRSAFDIAATIMLFEAASGVRRYLDTNRTGVGFDELVERIADGKREFFHDVAVANRPPRETFDKVLLLRAELKAGVHDFISGQGIDAILVPAVSAPPPLIGEEHHVRIGGAEVSFFDAFGRNTALSPTAGLPSLTIPAGLTPAGLPVSLGLDALPGRDRPLLQLGLAIEEAVAFRGRGRER